MKASNNRTINLTNIDREKLKEKIVKINKRLECKLELSFIDNKILNADLFSIVDNLPENSIDLLFLDPPYNITKNYNGRKFNQLTDERYAEWLESWLIPIKLTLRKNASIYFCCDWKTSPIVYSVCKKHFNVINRITFERDKGRGASNNWKNVQEDIWFFTNSKNYYFDVESVKVKRKVIAPYRDDGYPKDWEEENGIKFRLTCPSNLWTDITIPFWSMPENTPHPTQKPEKLIAKILLASTKNGDRILDPFGGVGTTATVAKKLRRNFISIEIDEEYCLYSIKRLLLAENDSSIQGYIDGVFWERNSNALTKRRKNDAKYNVPLTAL